MADREQADSHPAMTAADESEMESTGGVPVPTAAAEVATSPDIQRPGQLIRIASQQMQAQNQLEEMRRRGLPRMAGEDGRRGTDPGQYL